MAKEQKTPKVVVKKYGVDLEPPLCVYYVEIDTDAGVWEETFGALDHLQIFLKGVRIGLDIIGMHLPEPEISQEAEPLPEQKHFAFPFIIWE